MHAGLMHRIVFVNFSECKQCRLLCWRTYQVFSRMTYIYEVSSFAYYDILYLLVCLIWTTYFKSFINLREHLQNALLYVYLYFFIFFFFFVLILSDFDLLFIKGLRGHYSQGCGFDDHWFLFRASLCQIEGCILQTFSQVLLD